ncbi:MAG: AAA family ATPase, partial [Acidimicrobiia bacterium]|nr:AAA family ATPase [Acidimicrobiia bacterium]
FEDWVRATAEELRLSCGQAHDDLASACAATGDYAGAISAINSWLELDPLREPAYRRLMLLNAWAGDRVGAVEAYRRCVATLDQELGVDPLKETTELHGAILDEDLPPAPSSRRRVEVKTAPVNEPPSDLLARESELTELLKAVRDRNNGRVIRLAGDPWMGKTRLLDELTDAAAAEGRPVARARAYRTESHLPYGVVRQMLDSIVAGPQSLTEIVAGWAIAEAARIHPALGDPPDTPPNDPLGETRLFDALFELLTVDSLVLAVDDTQWADPASLTFLAYLGRRLADTSCLFVFAHRIDEPTKLAPLIEAVEVAYTTHLELSPLTAEQIGEHLGDHPAAVDLLARTGGVPALVADGLQSDDDSEATAGIRRFMEVRLGDLNDLNRQVMTTAAVLDGAATIDLVQATSGRTDDEVADAAEELIARRILIAEVDGTLKFEIASMERLVYDQTSLVRRRLLHRRAAAALETMPGSEGDPGLATVIARHHHAGGHDAEAAHWYVEAADLARRVFASNEAIEAYNNALDLGHPEVSRIRLSLGDTLLFAGRFTDALTEFEKAAAYGEGPERALAEHHIGNAHRRLGNLDNALGQFRMAQEDHPDRVSLHSDWALALLRVDDRRGAREQADRAVVASQQSEPEGRSRALAVLGMVTPHRDESEKVLREALTLAGDDPVLKMGALNGLAYSLGQTGADEEPLALVKEGLEIASRIGDKHRQGALFNHLADIHHRAGRNKEAEDALTEAVKLLVEIEPGSWQPEVWLLTNW